MQKGMKAAGYNVDYLDILLVTVYSGEKRVARLMAECGIHSVSKRQRSKQKKEGTDGPDRTLHEKDGLCQQKWGKSTFIISTCLIRQGTSGAQKERSFTTIMSLFPSMCASVEPPIFEQRLDTMARPRPDPPPPRAPSAR